MHVEDGMESEEKDIKKFVEQELKLQSVKVQDITVKR